LILTTKITNTYFKDHGIDGSFYEGHQIPFYLLSRLPKNKEAKILDIGCGLGQFLRSLKEDHAYREVLGLDLSPEALQFCKSQNLDVYQLDESGDFEQWLAFNPDWKERFDFITMSHVLEHIPKERIISSLKTIRKMLKKDGKASLMIMVPNAQSATDCYWAYEDFTHSCLFTAGSLIYVLKSAGFEVVELVDPKCLEGLSLPKRLFRSFFQKLYELNRNFWNKITGSSYHKPSPRVYSFEVKVLAR
jgi:SAM-dependent methyltransferase